MLVFQNVLWLLVLIGVMILIHELGHFWAARYFDVRVDVFSFGFGPRLFGFRKGETDYRFSAILFGGYVKMAGEQPGEEGVDDPRGFLAKPRWQRLVIAFAGPFMNVVLAVALLTGLYMVKFQKVVEPDGGKAIIGHVMPDSPAARAGIQDGDQIVAIDGKDNPAWEDIALKEVAGAGRPLAVSISRKGRRFDVTVVPELDDRSGVGFAGWSERGDIQLGTLSPGMPAEKSGLRRGDLILSANGVSIHSVIRFHEIIRNSKGKPVDIVLVRGGRQMNITVNPVLSNLDGPERWMIGAVVEQKLNVQTMQLSFPAALQESVNQNMKGASLIFQFLSGILERRMSPKSLEGPIRIAQLSGEAAREGPSAFIMLMSMVSLNLAIFNLLPIPILDGGVILLLFIEMLMRRDLSLSVKEAVFKVGFVFIMVIVVFVLYNDISKILPAG
ncbi:MAG TPA: RIP metalloprotease RseP [Bryobacteraceae bacterium]|nr:RIP metalloprotease RseP [Bryobacteraceae bacterium]